MRYICLVHFDPSLLDAMPAAERKIFDRRSAGYDKELEAKGHYVIAEAIEGGESAVLVRVRDGQVATTDGPYIETKEQMAGFILIEARDMNEALRLAAGIPLAELGTIEVRPVYRIPDPGA
ncbi:MAG TPA: YciI family protein [Devosia sp.]|nr:YciI family protein [Devosia sp.]